jgi:hypothetical protein
MGLLALIGKRMGFAYTHLGHRAFPRGPALGAPGHCRGPVWPAGVPLGPPRYVLAYVFGGFGAAYREHMLPTIGNECLPQRRHSARRVGRNPINEMHGYERAEPPQRLRAGGRSRGLICQFVLACAALCPDPTCTPIPNRLNWAHGMELEPPEPPRAAVIWPRKISSPRRRLRASAGGGASSQSRAEGQARQHRWVRASKRHAARVGNCRGLEFTGGLSRWPLKPPSLVHQYRVSCLLEITNPGSHR